MSVVCSKDFTITVNGTGGRFYWTFDEPNPGDSHPDKFVALPLSPFANPLVDPSGRYGRAIRFDTPAFSPYLTNDPVLFGNDTRLAYTHGTGFTFWFWLKCNAVGNTSLGTPSIVPIFLSMWDITGTIQIFQLDFQFDGSGINSMDFFAAVEDYVNPQTETINLFPVAATVGLWQLIVVKFDPSNAGKISIKLNNGAWVNGIKSFDFQSSPQGNIAVFGSGGGEVSDWSLDEMGLYYKVLTDPELTTLWNGGSGITWPAVQSLA